MVIRVLTIWRREGVKDVKMEIGRFGESYILAGALKVVYQIWDAEKFTCRRF